MAMPKYEWSWENQFELQKRSKRLTRAVCKLLGVRPTHAQSQEVTDAIYLEFAPSPKAAGVGPNPIEVLQQVAARWDKDDEQDAPELGAAIRAAIAGAKRNKPTEDAGPALLEALQLVAKVYGHKFSVEESDIVDSAIAKAKRA
jgi:hypothetical protein